MDILLQDIRFAVRTLVRSRGFTVLAVLCLALGIGVNTAVYSLVRGLLLRPLPFENGDRLVAVWATDERRGVDEAAITWADLEALRAAGIFAAVEGMQFRSFTLLVGERPERIDGAAVTPGFFTMIGAQPQLGRNFNVSEGAAAGFEQVVLISDGLWRSRFGADPGIVGQSVLINGRQLTIAGVMQPGFRFPETNDLWVPLGTTDPTNRQARYVLAAGVLAPGMTLDAANARLRDIAARWRTDHPETHRAWDLRGVPFRETQVDRNAQRLLWIMLGAVGFVLLIACANVANLMLARATDRQREIAVRAALGAGRKRVVRQLLTESVLLALAGGGAGVILSIWWVDAMVRTIPEELPFWLHFEPDGAVLLYTLLIAVLTGVLFGLMPALHAAKFDLQTTMRESAQGAGQTREHNRWRSALVVGEIALSMMLLVGAALMVQSFLRLQAASPGFDEDRLLSFRVTLAGDAYDAVEARAHYFTRAADRLAQLPGVIGAAPTGAIPADDGGIHRHVRTEDDTRAIEDAIVATEVAAGRGLFDALGVGLLAGRDFTPEELADTAARVAIIGERLAQRLFPGQDPVGAVLRVGDDAGQRFTIIGLAPDLQYEEFGEEEEADRLQFHVPYARWASRQMAFVVRGNGDPAGLIASVRDELAAIDPSLAAWDIQTMSQRRRLTTWPQRIFGKTFGTFGATALVLALAGVYGVMAWSVARRRRELGVRVALGARPADVLRLVLGRSGVITALGVALGLAGSLALTRMLTGIIWGVSPTDTATLAGTAVLLAGAALLASWIPARRAARVDPIEALRPD